MKIKSNFVDDYDDPDKGIVLSSMQRDYTYWTLAPAGVTVNTQVETSIWTMMIIILYQCTEVKFKVFER